MRINFLTDYKKMLLRQDKKCSLTIENILEYVAVIKVKFSHIMRFYTTSTEYLNRFLLNSKDELVKSSVCFSLCEKNYTIYIR
jgi:hypothetical protein